jgi:Ca-activated chloride channel homolog
LHTHGEQFVPYNPANVGSFGGAGGRQKGVAMDMFLWPWVLLLVGFIPLSLWLYRRAFKKSTKTVLLYPYFSLVASLNKRQNRKHATAFLYVAAILMAIFAVARPMLNVPQIDPQAGIILALDVSRSMRTPDVEPNRFEAAREAIRTFVKELPDDTRVGLVTFSDYALQTVPITDDHARVLQAVDLLTLGAGTAIGDAMLESLAAFPSLEERDALGEPERLATLILLSDGKNYSGIEPLEALEELKAQQIRVHTIGVGNPNADIGYGFTGAGGFDEESLRTIASETGGQFIFADSSHNLSEAYRDIKKTLLWKVGRDEASAAAALLAAMLLMSSLVVAQLRRKVV